ncbi:hypothetical protein FGB62_213g03 [Gracilaria domingensis]|nr:hypothetical protein FGB62_213g03 [Gracilaria domingensis]
MRLRARLELQFYLFSSPLSNPRRPWVIRAQLPMDLKDVPFYRRSSLSLQSSQHIILGDTPPADQDESFRSADDVTRTAAVSHAQSSPSSSALDTQQGTALTVPYLSRVLSIGVFNQLSFASPSPQPTKGLIVGLRPTKAPDPPFRHGIFSLPSFATPSLQPTKGLVTGLRPTKAPDPPFRHIRVAYMAYTQVVYRGCDVPASFRLTLTANGGPCTSQERFPTNGSFVIAIHGAYGEVQVKTISPHFESLPVETTDFLKSRQVCCTGSCVCADGSSPQGCYPSTCATAEKPCDEAATCVDNSCSGCNPEWFNSNGKEACL